MFCILDWQWWKCFWLWGLSQAYKLFFYSLIVHSMFSYSSRHLVSNAHYFQWNSAASTHMTTIDTILQCRYNWLVSVVSAAQWTNSCTTIQYFHSCAPIWCSTCSISTYVTQDRTRHPGFPAVQLRLTCDQIRTGSESVHVKYGANAAKEKKRNGNNWEPCQDSRLLASSQHWTFDIFNVL